MVPRLFRVASLILLLLFSSSILVSEEGGSKVKSEFQRLSDALTEGTFSFDLRLRVEIADQEGLKSSQAWTERIRLGYGSGTYHGFSFFLELEDLHSIDDDLYYNGVTGDPGKTLIADPEDTELNQGYGQYRREISLLDTEFFTRLGRQRILLDDQRFVGNVGWRQNEQTFDAVSVMTGLSKAFSLFYAYLWDVNRIFGPDADVDFKSDSHLINLSHRNIPHVGTVSAFGYFLDFANSDANSSNTIGARVAGDQNLHKDVKVSYILSYAYQADAGENPTDYAASYYLVQGSLAMRRIGFAGIGYEVLGSDDNKFAFRTPLATLHKFNGWADVFLTTPVGGLQDFYLFVGGVIPVVKVSSRFIWHWFSAEDVGGDYGTEYDMVFSRPLNEQITVLTKFAVFNGAPGFADRYKWWLQTEIKF